MTRFAQIVVLGRYLHSIGLTGCRRSLSLHSAYSSFFSPAHRCGVPLSLCSLLQSEFGPSLDLVELYIDCGAPVLGVGNENPLNIAASEGLVDAVQLLLSRGACVDEPVFARELLVDTEQVRCFFFSGSENMGALEALEIVLARAVELYPHRVDHLLMLLCCGLCLMVKSAQPGWEGLLATLVRAGANVACVVDEMTPLAVACGPHVEEWLRAQMTAVK